MGVGIIEILFVLLTSIVVAIVTRRRSADKPSSWPNRKWLWGVPAIFAIASATSPADMLSTCCYAVPTAILYVSALLRMEKRLTPVAE